MKNKGTLGRVLKYIKKYTPKLVLSVIFAAVTSLLALYIPILVGNAIDMAVSAGNVDMAGIAREIIKIAVCIIAVIVSQWLMNILNNNITYGVTRDMRNDAIRKIESLPLSYVDSHPTGEIVSKVITDVDQVTDGLLMGFSQFFTGIVTIFGTIGFMLYLNWKVALVVILITPLSLITASFIAKKTYSFFGAQSKIRGEQTAFIGEMLGNEKVVKAFSHEEKSIEKFEEINRRLEKSSLKAVFFSSLTNPSTRFINNIVYAGVCLFGAIAVISGGDGALTVGTLSSFLMYANQYTKPFNEISGVVTELQNALACAARVFDLLDAQSQSDDDENAPESADISGRVSLDDVSFSYDKSRTLIEHLSLDAAPGKRVAIVGPTGCGKTTVINLLMRFYDVDSGKISVDGTDIRNMRRRVLRRSYGMVLQETWLKSGTIRENIAFGKPDATDEEIIAAAKAAHAHSFIRRLENGYDTFIGEDGGSLSQGQKQLLCIARVMLCLPPMLILDEATSSIDTRTEMKIQNAFSSMMRGRTSFIVAHRLSTIREADVILVMRDGHVIEQGKHAELLEKGGFYSELYNSQFKK